MSSFINGYVIEIRQFPRSIEQGDGNLEWFSMKDYFIYDSNTKEYGHRDTVIPVSDILNKEEIPDINTMRNLINNRVTVIKRFMNFKEQTQSWIFDTSKLGETE
jgi:hypothetical protein